MVTMKTGEARGRSASKVWTGILFIGVGFGVKPLVMALFKPHGGGVVGLQRIANMEGVMDAISLAVLLIGIVLIIKGARKTNIQNKPVGYNVPLRNFSELVGIDESELMEHIRNGKYRGEVIDREWFVHEDELKIVGLSKEIHQSES